MLSQENYVFSEEALSEADYAAIITPRKFYVKPSEIILHENKIFILVDEKIIEVDCIMTDNIGYYCLFGVQGYPDSWDCPKCGTHNTNKKCCSICCYWPNGGK